MVHAKAMLERAKGDQRVGQDQLPGISETDDVAASVGSGHRARLRERLLTGGPEALAD